MILFHADAFPTGSGNERRVRAMAHPLPFAFPVPPGRRNRWRRTPGGALAVPFPRRQ